MSQLVYVPIKCLILDFDGTLVDTKHFYFSLAGKYLNREPEELISIADEISFSKMPSDVRNVKWLIIRTVYRVSRTLGYSRVKSMGAVDYVRKNHSLQFEHAHPTEDAIYALKRLNAAKINLVIASLSPRKKIDTFIQKHLKRTDYFPSDHILAAGDFGKHKENAIVHFLRKFYLTETPRSMAIVGDLPGDTIAGKNVGISTIGLTTGFATKEILRQPSPDAIFSNLLELEKRIHLFLVEEK